MGNQHPESEKAAAEGDPTQSAPNRPSSRPVFLPPRPTPSAGASPWPPSVFPWSLAPRLDSLSGEKPDSSGSLADAQSGSPKDPTDALEKEVALLKAQLSAAEVLVRRAQEEASLLRKTMEQERARLALVSHRGQELEQRISELEAESTGLLAKLEGQQSAAQAVGNGADDLTAIRGIGPAFARALRSQGITHLSQIAGWSDPELEQVARLLRVSAERIRREGWIDSARRLVGAGD